MQHPSTIACTSFWCGPGQKSILASLSKLNLKLSQPCGVEGKAAKLFLRQLLSPGVEKSSPSPSVAAEAEPLQPCRRRRTSHSPASTTLELLMLREIRMLKLHLPISFPVIRLTPIHEGSRERTSATQIRWHLADKTPPMARRPDIHILDSQQSPLKAIS